MNLASNNTEADQMTATVSSSVRYTRRFPTFLYTRLHSLSHTLLRKDLEVHEEREKRRGEDELQMCSELLIMVPMESMCGERCLVPATARSVFSGAARG